MMDILKVIVVDDHPIFLKGLNTLLNDLAFCKVVASANNGKKFLELLKLHDPDIVFMDIKMPVMNGIEATEKALEMKPLLKIIGLTMFDESKYVSMMKEAGAKGFISKNVRKDKLIEVIQAIMRGGEYFDDVDAVVSDLSIGSVPVVNDATLNLSEREREVLQLISAGYSSGEIADKLCISPRTVEGHRTNLINKTNSKNTVQLVTYAIRHGLVRL